MNVVLSYFSKTTLFGVVQECFDLLYVTLHAKRYHLVLKIFEFIVPGYKHGNIGLIGEGFTHL